MNPGHFSKGTGAVSLLDEVIEARKVAGEVVHVLKGFGVQDGVFQEVWLQRAKAGTLTVMDYAALSTLQLKKFL